MAKKPKKDNALEELIAATPPKALSDLILNLAADYPEIRRECFDYLKENATVSKMLKSQSEEEAIMATWAELLPDLEDLDEYGGGSYSVIDRVGELLWEILKKLESKKIGETYRYELLNSVLPFIESGNSGMNDALDDVAYASCYTDEDFRQLAERLVVMDEDWQTRNARNIYRQIGDHEKYLELRLKHMELGADYHDLATFYWESGEKGKSLQTAQKGLKKARGRMDELRAFVADRAKESGDRDTWIGLQFDQATDCLTLDTYKKFKAMCTVEEWKLFEPGILKKMKDAGKTEKMKIYMDRKAYEKVIKILVTCRYPINNWSSHADIRIAEKLEKQYPEKVLKWYLSGLGSLNSSQKREDYARKAEVMAKVRHILVDVIKDEERWKKFATKIKNDNLRRPAFQQEFRRIVPGWEALNEKG